MNYAMLVFLYHANHFFLSSSLSWVGLCVAVFGMSGF